MSTSGGSIAVRIVVIGVCLGGTLLGLRNTYGDNSEAEMKSKEAACGSGRDCTYRLLSQSRSAFSQTLTWQVSLPEQTGKGKQHVSASAEVECKRAYILLGDYECTLKSGGLPGTAASR